MRERILGMLESEGDLPPLPDIVIRIHDIVQRDDTSARQIASIIEMDPSLAGTIIKLSNSVYYTRSAAAIRTLPVAITKLGMKTLLKLVYSLKICPLFADSPFINSREFWTHSLAVAILTQSLSKRMHAASEQQDVAYLAGLMHDVGIMVLGYLVPLEYDAFLKERRTGNTPFVADERERFGIDHAEAGALYISQWWNLDPRIVDAVRHHHDEPATARGVNLVQTANTICNAQCITNGIAADDPAASAAVPVAVRIDSQELQFMIEEIQASVDQAKELVYGYVSW
jgi:HD-like signal output (HDOD) protein